MAPYDKSLQRYIKTCPPGEMKDNGFCAVCSSIDFTEIADIATSDLPRFGDVKVFHLPNLVGRSSSKADCPLCSIFLFVQKTVFGEDRKTAKTWWLYKCVYINDGTDINYTLLALKAEYDDCDPVSSLSDTDPFHLQLWPTESSNQTLHSISTRETLGNLRIAYRSITSQLRFCEEHHHHQQEYGSISNPTSTIEGVQLLDCQSLNVIHVPVPLPQYLALSYVWGRQDPLSLTAKAYPYPLHIAWFAGLVPRTIADAIRLTLILKQRYLWVDRYCVSQHDPIHFKQQLQLMGRIFATAWATIVATGSNDRLPLPGVSVNRRVPSFVLLPTSASREGSERFQCIALHDALQREHQIDKSAWNTRGWTFQEKVMSRRCIYICNNDVSITCPAGTWREAHQSRSEKLEHTLHGRESFTIDFNSAAHNYSGRELTEAKDALDAFRGYLGDCNRSTYWAVPIFLWQSSEITVAVPRTDSQWD